LAGGDLYELLRRFPEANFLPAKGADFVEENSFGEETNSPIRRGDRFCETKPERF
jgi:hypothetical protein